MEPNISDKQSADFSAASFPKNSNILVLCIVAIVFLGLGLVGGYIFRGSNTSQNTNPATPKLATNPTPTPEVWKYEYLQSCSFSINIPEKWTISENVHPQFSSIGNMFGCVSIQAANSTFTLQIDKVQIGSKLYDIRNEQHIINIPINTVDGYITAVTNTIQPAGAVQNIQERTIGKYTGKYFEFNAATNNSYFVFEHEGYLYVIVWDQSYNETYKSYITQLISKISFAETLPK